MESKAIVGVDGNQSSSSTAEGGGRERTFSNASNDDDMTLDVQEWLLRYAPALVFAHQDLAFLHPKLTVKTGIEAIK